MESVKNTKIITNFVDKVKRNPVDSVKIVIVVLLLILLAIYILYQISLKVIYYYAEYKIRDNASKIIDNPSILLKKFYYYAKYKIRDNAAIQYNKTLTNEIDLTLTKYILEKCDNKLNIQEGIEKLSNEEMQLINDIGHALCDFDKFKSDDALKTEIDKILKKYNSDSLANLKNQINAQINRNKLDKKENRLEKQNVKAVIEEDTKDFSRYLPVSKKNKGSSYGFVMKKAISGKFSKNDAKTYLQSKYTKIHCYKQDFENKYAFAYGIGKDALKEELNFDKFDRTVKSIEPQGSKTEDEMRRRNFKLQNASKNEYLIYKLFKILDPQKYEQLKERKIIGKKGIVVKLIPTINKKLSEASPKEMIKCLIESMIVELNDFKKSDNYIFTNQGVLNIDFGIREPTMLTLKSGTERNVLELLTRAIDDKVIKTVGSTLLSIVKIAFSQQIKKKYGAQGFEIIDVMNNAINNLTYSELIEILNEVINRDKANAMKKVCDDFYQNEANNEYKNFYPKKQSDGYLELVNAFESSGFRRQEV